MWKEKVRLAYLLLENKPVITHRLSLIIVNNTMIGQIIRDNLLSFAPDLLTRQSDRSCAILLRRFEEVVQPGEEAQT